MTERPEDWPAMPGPHLEKCCPGPGQGGWRLENEDLGGTQHGGVGLLA